MTGEYAKNFNKFHHTKVEVNEATIDEVINYGHFMKKSDVEMTEATDLYKALGDDVYHGPEEQPAEHQQQEQWLPTRYEPDAYYNTVQSSAPRQIDWFTIALGKKTGTIFPIDIKNQKYFCSLWYRYRLQLDQLLHVWDTWNRPWQGIHAQGQIFHWKKHGCIRSGNMYIQN